MQGTGAGATGVRIDGDVVRRRTGPWTPAVHDLLRHVRTGGIVEAPEVLGLTDDGDEAVAFIPGEVPTTLTEAQLAAVGGLLGRLRPVLAAFPSPAERTWRGVPGGTALCHGDVAPWNLVLEGDRVVGLLDWDLAGVATPLYDLAYAAWTCVPLEPHGHGVDVQARRLRLLVDAYGATAGERLALLSEIAYAQTRVGFHLGRGAATGDLGLPALWWGGRRVGALGRSMVWLDEHWDDFAEALA